MNAFPSASEQQKVATTPAMSELRDSMDHSSCMGSGVFLGLFLEIKV